MRVHTYPGAGWKLASLLEIAQRDGAVRIRRKGGQVFALPPEPTADSPLDVVGIEIDMTSAEIVDTIRDGRERYG